LGLIVQAVVAVAQEQQVLQLRLTVLAQMVEQAHQTLLLVQPLLMLAAALGLEIVHMQAVLAERVVGVTEVIPLQQVELQTQAVAAVGNIRAQMLLQAVLVL
jgi:hypothetical protein